MAQEWYYAQGDQKVGPVSARELKQAAADGTLQTTDLVWTDGMTEWKEARSVKGLAGLWTTQPAAAPAASTAALAHPATRPPARRQVARPTRSAGGRVGEARGEINLPAKLGLAGAGAFALMVLACCGGLAVMSGGKGGHQSHSASAEVQDNPAIKVDAVCLFDDYEANEVSADEKYKGKVLEVSGVVVSIGKDLFDTIYVTLMVGGEFQLMKVQCFFGNESKAEAAKLSKGQRVVVRGRCGGKFLNVVVNDCAFVGPN
jgi:hypothetical protein